MAGGDWCARCHHMVIPLMGQYVHYSDDDWTGGPDSECACATDLVPCRPEGSPFSRAAACVHVLSAAAGRLSGAVSGATAQWASLASAIAEPEEKQ